MWRGWGGHLLIDVSVFHFAVELGEFDRQDDAGDEKDQAPGQAEPECILRRRRERRGGCYATQRKIIFTIQAFNQSFEAKVPHYAKEKCVMQVSHCDITKSTLTFVITHPDW